MYKRLTWEEFFGNMSDRVKGLTNDEILNIISNGGGRVYFCGVGGVSMCSLFCLTRYFGIAASGSDRRESPILSSLKYGGEDIIIGERADIPKDTSLFVYSHAIAEEHSERRIARLMGVPEVSRAEYMGALMRCYENRIGISGSHGKSTVTAMVTKIFSDLSLLPTSLSGANLFSSDLPFLVGTLDYLIYESCEYKDSFLSFSPTVGLFLNMELDHTDYFSDFSALERSFLAAMKRAERIIVNADDLRLTQLAKRSGKRVVTYGRVASADYRYEPISTKPGAMRFLFFKDRRELGEVHLPMLGEFNMSNAAAALSVASELSLDFCEAAHSLSEFSGISRRLERIGKFHGREIYYDYAHHPTEIKASVRAVKECGKGRVTVIFRPHTYSRTKDLWKGFIDALSEADFSLLLPVDAVREQEDLGVSSEALALAVGGMYCADISDIEKNLAITEGDIILMGAADVGETKKFLTEKE